MEKRKITVWSSRTQASKVIMSGAETLGELKKDCDEAGIDYAGFTFYEGLTKTELLNDDSLLPKDVVYKGQVTNDLVFVITVGEKKTVSGSDRSDLYDFVKNNDLQDDILREFGKSFTNCSNVELKSFVSSKDKTLKTKKSVNKENTQDQFKAIIVMVDKAINDIKAKNKKDENPQEIDEKKGKSLEGIEGLLYTINKLLEQRESKVTSKKKDKELKSPYSEKELSNLIDSLKK